MGDAEIAVTDRDRIRYAAPQLIFHYIVHHEHQPPSGFVEAVPRRVRGIRYTARRWCLVRSLLS